MASWLIFLAAVSVTLLAWLERLGSLAPRTTVDTNSWNLTHNVDGSPNFDRKAFK
jgi:hypothetical protein